jgi:hypothetical protein
MVSRKSTLFSDLFLAFILLVIVTSFITVALLASACTERITDGGGRPTSTNGRSLYLRLLFLLFILHRVE